MGSRERRGDGAPGIDAEGSGKYRKECAEMELQVAELKSALKRKNLEIEKLKVKNCAEGSRQTRVDSKTVRALQEMRTYEAFLMQENEHLRRAAGGPADISRLQREIKDVLREQHLYKSKLLELHDRPLSDTPILHKRAPAPSIQSLRSTQQELTSQRDTVREELKEMEEERDYFKNTVVPVLQRTVDLFGQYKKTLTGEIEELLKKTEVKPTGEKKDHRQISVTILRAGGQLVPTLPPISPTSLPSKSLISPRMASSASLHTKSSSLSTAAPGFVYAPSYLRVKRRPVKVKTRRDTQSAGTIQEVEDEFANSFPDEDELQ